MESALISRITHEVQFIIAQVFRANVQRPPDLSAARVLSSRGAAYVEIAGKSVFEVAVDLAEALFEGGQDYPVAVLRILRDDLTRQFEVVYICVLGILLFD